MKVGAKLTVNDKDLIHGLYDLRMKHQILADGCDIQKQVHLKTVKSLSNSAIAIKFDVAESTIRRVLSNNV
jgi:hypothetical protein